MRITRLRIQGFKSLPDVTLINPSPFLAFCGPNASGKSNLFEALRFLDHGLKYREQTPVAYAGLDAIFDINAASKRVIISMEIEGGEERKLVAECLTPGHFNIVSTGSSLEHFGILNNAVADMADLTGLLRTIAPDDHQWADMIESLQIMVPGFKTILLSPANEPGLLFEVLEKGAPRPIPVSSVSSGTYHLINLLARLYAYDEPQFLCIEHPENFIHPEAIELLADLLRECCEERGHIIWVTTHSQTLVRCLDIDEIALVNKFNGETRIKQFTKDDKVTMKLDEAWLSNALGGGVLFSLPVR